MKTLSTHIRRQSFLHLRPPQRTPQPLKSLPRCQEIASSTPAFSVQPRNRETRAHSSHQSSSPAPTTTIGSSSDSGTTTTCVSSPGTTTITADLSTIFSKPSWSVRSLLPAGEVEPQERITARTLHHLLRLSSLPTPATTEEEASMLSILQSQLHFVRDIQSVDTSGVEPLQAIRDETIQGEKDITIGLDLLKHVLEREVVVGHNKRPRRRKTLPVETNGTESWDALSTPSKRIGRYFVVDSGALKGTE